MWIELTLALALPATLAWVGWSAFESTGAALVGAAAGGLLAWLGGHLLVRQRAEVLEAWLRRDVAQSAPLSQAPEPPAILRGLWAGLAERIARSLRKRERETQHQALLHEQFLEAIQASPNGVLLLDAEGRIEWCNATAAAHFALDPRRDRLQHVQHLIRDPAFVGFLQKGDYSDAQACLLQRPGVGTVMVQMHPYGEGRRLMLSHDVTERERADRMRQDFVANVSHEIRTPLTVLSGFLETMASIPVPEPDRQRYLGLMRQQTHRMQTLVADLLTLARLEGASLPPTDTWVSLAVIRAQAELEANALSQGRHDIRFFFDESVLEVAGNEAEIQSLASNLISNAIRHTPDEGVIEIGFAWYDEGHWALFVRDSGVGIAPEHLSRLTERFYRVDRSRSRDTGGTGLGLAIVKHVLLRHGGELQIESTPNQGSTFRALLPSARVRQVALSADALVE